MLVDNREEFSGFNQFIDGNLLLDLPLWPKLYLVSGRWRVYE